VCELQGEGNVTFYNNVSLSYRVREMLLYIKMCLSEIQGEDFVSEYNYVCLRYRFREIILYTLICV